MYSPETIRKAVNRMRAEIDKYMSMRPQDIKLCISNGNRKVGRVLNVSTAAVVTCPNCKECCKWCYELKAYLLYSSCLDARARNTALLWLDRDEYFNRIDARLNRRRRGWKAFRWHVGGEIPDTDYFARMVEIARKHQDWIFWTYTKNYSAVNAYVRDHGNDRKAAVPQNLTVMFSKWDGMPMDNPYGFPVFECIMISKGASFKKGVHVCPGNCEICLTEKRGCPYGQSTQCADH